MIKLKLSDNDQDGFAAIVVVLVLILVLSLITIGFAQLMQANQKNALSKQLSNQAYYAAESGVNDAVEAFEAGYDEPKTTCDSSSVANITGAPYLQSPTVNGSTNSSVTCLLVNPTPPNLAFGNIKSGQPIVAEMQGCATTGGNVTPTGPCGQSNPSNVGYINISWQDNGDNNGLTIGNDACTKLYPNGGWSSQNILRMELIPISGNDPTINRNSLINNAYTAYLCPDNTGPASYPVTSSNLGNNSGDILSSQCTPINSNGAAPYNCRVKLNVGNLRDLEGDGYSTFFLILRGVYNSPIDATVTMQDTSSQSLNIADSQLMVDSTGKAQYVLKRIQVRVAETNQYYVPLAAIEGQICKQLELSPPGTGLNIDITPCNVYR